jgi:predicted aspartyl protease
LIHGAVNAKRDAVIPFSIVGKSWEAVIDSGFNGDLELPESLRLPLRAERIGTSHTSLAGGQSIIEDVYEVSVDFDGEHVRAQATFVPDAQILVGARLMRRHRLEIDYPRQTVLLERSQSPA